MALINMTVYPRSTTGKNANRRTRVAGRTPAVIYGDQREESLNVELDTVVLEKALSRAGGQNLMLALKMDGSEDSFVAVMRELQIHPVSDEIFHCDLFQIPLGVPLRLEVGLNIIGTNKWVKSGDALLETVNRTVEVECLPRQVPDGIDVDISELKIGGKLTVADLSLAEGQIITDAETILVKVTPNLLVAVEDEVAETAAPVDEAAEETNSD
jgi:large subunit ribosomal protein L25